jgi:hypothetical protein
VNDFILDNIYETLCELKKNLRNWYAFMHDSKGDAACDLTKEIIYMFLHDDSAFKDDPMLMEILCIVEKHIINRS